MKIRALDLFHGAGGSSLGAQAAGAEIVAGIDFWSIASDCYRRNFPKALAIHADIRDVSPVELHDADWRHRSDRCFSRMHQSYMCKRRCESDLRRADSPLLRLSDLQPNSSPNGLCWRMSSTCSPGMPTPSLQLSSRIWVTKFGLTSSMPWNSVFPSLGGDFFSFVPFQVCPTG